MKVQIKPSDLQYRYPKNKELREHPKFTGKPDPAPFDRDDLYEVIPMFEQVMGELGSNNGDLLHLVEEILNNRLPRFVSSREDVFDCLVGAARELMKPPR